MDIKTHTYIIRHDNLCTVVVVGNNYLLLICQTPFLTRVKGVFPTLYNTIWETYSSLVCSSYNGITL